jgi:hypothetical protein
MYIFRLFSSLFTIALLFTACTKKHIEKWDTIKVNPNLSKDSIFTKMDKQKEFIIFPKFDSTLKQSSRVAILIGEKHSRADSLNSSFSTCKAYFHKADTLNIHIGLDGPFGGSGIDISYHNNKFNTKGYQYSDVVPSGKLEKPLHWVIHQQLVLDKASYKIGDSLYGYIDFKVKERNEIGDTVVYSAQGKFRAKVLKYDPNY